MSLIGRELLEEGLINLERWFFFKKGFLGRGFIRGGLFQRVLIQEGASLRRDYFERDLLTGAY